MAGLCKGGEGNFAENPIPERILCYLQNVTNFLSVHILHAYPVGLSMSEMYITPPPFPFIGVNLGIIGREHCRRLLHGLRRVLIMSFPVRCHGSDAGPGIFPLRLSAAETAQGQSDECCKMR